MNKISINEEIELVTRLSTSTYRLNNKTSVSVTLHTGKQILLFDDDKADVFEILSAWVNYEPIIEILYKYWTHNFQKTLLSILEDYTANYYIRIKPSVIVFKLYHPNKPKELERTESGRSWIDFSDLKEGNSVKDIKNGCGLWTFYSETFPKVINKETLNRYGHNILILQTKFFTRYIRSQRELIGTKYKCLYNGSLDQKETWNTLIYFLGNEVKTIDMNKLYDQYRNIREL